MSMIMVEDEKKIKSVVESFRLMVQTHGGDVKIESIKGKTVNLKLFGACAKCSLAHFSYDIILGGLIREAVPGVEIKFKKLPVKNAKFKRV